MGGLDYLVRCLPSRPNHLRNFYNLPEGLSASEEVSLMTSPRPVAAASFISGDPFSMVSLKNLKK